MAVIEEVGAIVINVLQLDASSLPTSEDTQLLGSIPEFDSMAVVAVITAFEEGYGIEIDDDEISAEVFQSLGSLASFLSDKLA
jgi:acyl carrier protein